MAIHYPCITTGHCAAHLVWLFFKDIYTQCLLFFNLHQFAKRLRNIFGSCHHAPHAIFKKYTKLHNRGLHLEFIKDTEVRMARAHIALCCVLQLKNALRATINLAKFIALRAFKEDISILQSKEFWNYLFFMCRALYAPMHLLRLADQKVAAMDKMHFYVCQTDAIMSYYLAKAVSDSSRCTHDGTLRLMNACAQDIYDKASNSDEEDVDNDDKESSVEDDLDKEMPSNEEESEDDAEDEDDDSTAAFTTNAIGASCGQLRHVPR